MIAILPMLLIQTGLAWAEEKPAAGVKTGSRIASPRLMEYPVSSWRTEGKPGSRDAVLSSAARFVPVPPCRVADTRDGGKPAPYGSPTPLPGSVRSIPVPQSGCGVPQGAVAYSLNITAVPTGALGYLVAYPTGQARPLVSTLNSPDGSVVANAAMVPAGANGSIDVFVTDRADFVIDINGYFVTNDQGLQIYTVTPCRVMDTRAGMGKTGAFGPPFLAGGSARAVPIPDSDCGVPASAGGYLLNITVVPREPLAYLTVWPAGSERPLVSTLNSFEGRVVANAAVVTAGVNGAIGIFVTNNADVILDVNGYIAP